MDCKPGDSYIHSRDWMKKTKATINAKTKDANVFNMKKRVH